RDCCSVVAAVCPAPEALDSLPPSGTGCCGGEDVTGRGVWPGVCAHDAEALSASVAMIRNFSKRRRVTRTLPALVVEALFAKQPAIIDVTKFITRSPFPF
ncbi:MAG: hypothetical protein H0V88_15500, partial [Pyrinomonadaceae bacterium]|nr:hypothetical protein [Pyrinomonadaceae bacterium]